MNKVKILATGAVAGTVTGIVDKATDAVANTVHNVTSEIASIFGNLNVLGIEPHVGGLEIEDLIIYGIVFVYAIKYVPANIKAKISDFTEVIHSDESG